MSNKLQLDKKFNRKEIVEIVLKGLALSTIISGSIFFPNLPFVLATIVSFIKKESNGEISEKKIIRTLKVLEKKKIIDWFEKDGQVYVKIRQDNKTEILKYSIKKILDFKKQKRDWKRKWVLVVFDVPIEENKKRRFLRNLLKKLGFFQFQQSIYVFPYECLEEIKLIKEITSSGKYLKYIIAEKLEGEENIKRFFKLS